MKKFLKIVPMMVLALAFLLSGCNSDQETTRSTDETAAKVKLPVVGDDWKEIGYIKDGTVVLTINKNDALKRMSTNMKKYAGIDENYTDVYIVDFEGDYNLLFEGETYRSTFYVKAVASRTTTSANASQILVAGPRITCTTSDCSSEPTGCAVKYDNDDTGLPYCSPCSNGGKCTKTAISSDVALF